MAFAARVRDVATIGWLTVGIALGGLVAADSRSASGIAASLAVPTLAVFGGWLARRRPRAFALAGVVAGSIGVACGWAIGVRFLLSADPSSRSVVASVALVGGAALIGSSGIELLARLRWRWRAPACAAIAGAVILIGLAVMPGVLATNVPHVPVRGGDPSDRGIAFEHVSMRTADGIRLVAWYVPSRNGAGVVLRHGSGATRADELDHLQPLVAAGFGVLVPDSRGHGGSDGNGNDFGWSGEADILSAVDYLATRSDVDPWRIGVVGISLGGMEAIGAAAADPRIHAVVAEGPTRRSAADLAWLPEVRGVSGAATLAMVSVQTWVSGLVTDVPVPPSMADSVAAARDTSFFLVTAALPDERDSAAFIEARAPDRISVWVASSAHARGFQESPTDWSQRVVDFLSDHLLGS